MIARKLYLLRELEGAHLVSVMHHFKASPAAAARQDVHAGG